MSQFVLVWWVSINDCLILSFRQSVADKSQWEQVGDPQLTQASGRTEIFGGASDKILAGVYKLEFQVEEYFSKDGVKTFYPIVPVMLYWYISSNYY